MDDAGRNLVGQTLGGRFRLLDYLGEGAMASVYRGEQDGEPRDVAIKVMHPHLLRDETFAKRFIREAKAAACIEHRNSVRILGHGHDGDLLFLAMELLVGQDLFDTLARTRRFTELRAARVAIQICGALEAAHKRGIVHRDLKPENVFLVSDPDDPEADLVKVLDFGIAKILDRHDRPSSTERASGPPSSGPMSLPPNSVLTRVGSIVGTPEYMSPEQARGLPVDARSDVYSCGVLLFQMVTGRLPFTGSTPFDVVLQQADKPPPAPSSLLPGIHPGLETVILGALAKDKDRRPQSARELGELLGALLPEIGQRPRVLTVPAPRPSLLARAETEMLPGVPGEVALARADTEIATPRSHVTEKPSDEPPVEVFAHEDIHAKLEAYKLEREAATRHEELVPLTRRRPRRHRRWDPGWLLVAVMTLLCILLWAARWLHLV